MKLVPSLLAASLAAALSLPAAAADLDTVLAELKRLSARVESLEKQNKELEQALSNEHISATEPELATRLKATETQTLGMEGTVRKLAEAFEGVEIGASLTGMLQKVGAGGTASGAKESRSNYRGDLTVTLPGGNIGAADGTIFTHFRFGQGNGIGLRPSYTSTANTTAFETSAGSDDSFGILAQAWYQLAIPLLGEGSKADAREHIYLTGGKIDPFVFFDQNGIADDESARFANNVFVHNPLLDSGGDIGADAYGFAPGAIVKYENSSEKGAEWALSLGVFGSGPGANFSGNMNGPFVIAQAETAARINYLPGNYRLYIWHQWRGSGYDQIERKHAGFGLSVDQKISDNLSLFGRYGHQSQGKTRFDRALTLGAELDGSAWSRSADSLGLAFGSLRTSANFRRDSASIDADGDGIPDFSYQAGGTEKLVELYYRYKLNDKLELTPDLQWIRNAGGDANAPTVKIIGLRAKLGF